MESASRAREEGRAKKLGVRDGREEDTRRHGWHCADLGCPAI